MKRVQDLSPAEQQLWIRAAQSLAKNNEASSLGWLQLLIESEPNFFDARRLARKVASVHSFQYQQSFFSRCKKKIKSFVLLRKAALFAKNREFSKASVLLESLLADAPKCSAAHRLMIEVSMKNLPPSREIALLSFEALVDHDSKKEERLLELASFCLQSDQAGCAWNPERALKAYQEILAINPHHLAATQGLKNASAHLSLQEGEWNSEDNFCCKR